MAPWLMVLEAYAVQALLRTPGFHRIVEKVAKNVHRVRHGLPPEDEGGTSIQQPGQSGFAQHFVDEVKAQIGRTEARQADVHASSTTDEVAKRSEREDADAAWEQLKRSTEASGTSKAPKQGFLDGYMDALRTQVKAGKPR
ncbi:hypothetical protein B0A48_12740 [Cryoendolithus antarcticus]|uniref:Uncharacterized protein n=1 Tax=Cryoendolithus antarcticus TaxID=1507870 RepID=A0A1V8SRB0_9PEZI|nr:hypothetical protein B0A48_12740 [Cryoendolithus antarcticus]